MILFIWLGSALVTAVIASSKGRNSLGWLFLGVLFGPLAVLAVAIAGTDQRREQRAGLQSGKLRACPACAEAIKSEAVRCKHCGVEVPPVPRRGLFG
jgi:hypothetical protein